MTARKGTFLKKSFSKQEKLKEHVTSSPTHKDWQKKIFQTNREKNIGIHSRLSFPSVVLYTYLMTETKIITPPDTQEIVFQSWECKW